MGRSSLPPGVKPLLDEIISGCEGGGAGGLHCFLASLPLQTRAREAAR